MDGGIGQFISNVLKTLYKNGYPEKKVALPLERMYELASEKGHSFNKVLEFLKEKEGIDHEKSTQKIIFFPVAPQPIGEEKKASFDFAGVMDVMKGIDPSLFTQNTSMAGIIEKAAQMVKNMDPGQIKQIQDMVSGLSQEEKESLLKKAKDLGFPG